MNHLSAIIFWDYKETTPFKDIKYDTDRITKAIGNCEVYDEVNTYDDNIAVLVTSRKDLTPDQVDMLYEFGYVIPCSCDNEGNRDEDCMESINMILEELKTLGIESSMDEFE
jgi:hypothetical protein